jgi:dienelactone hydrolase
MLSQFRGLFLLLFLASQGYSAVALSADYRIGGVNPEALLCRPDGRVPSRRSFITMGVGVDTVGYQKAVRRGYDLPGICKELSADGFLTFVPIRQGGPGLRNLPPHKAQVLEAIDYVKRLPDVDPSRIALTGNSRGGLLTLMVGLEQPDLKALVVMAPAEIGRNFSNALSQIPSLNTPVLLLVEKSDESEFQNNFDALDSALREHKKDVKSIRYDRGGGHNLFHSSGYYLQDVKVFLRERLNKQK